MPISVVMPALEMAQETGKLVSWKKREGEPVKKGEMLLEVETDKAVVAPGRIIAIAWSRRSRQRLYASTWARDAEPTANVR